jgi:hypothetical protein
MNAKQVWDKYHLPIIAGLILLGVIVIIVLRKQLANYFNKSANLIMFNSKVAAHLNQLNPEYRGIFEKFISGIIALGYEPQINSSYRTFAQQAVEYAADSRNAKPGYSYHNYGLAIDVQVSKGGKTWGKSTSVADWNATGIPQLAKSLGLTWGGTFAGYLDAVHFDYRVKTTPQLYAMATAQFGSDVNTIKGNEVNIA